MLQISNLDSATNTDDLKHLFYVFGKVIGCSIMADPDYATVAGFVEMESEHAADVAIAALDHQLYFGNRLSVRRIEASIA